MRANNPSHLISSEINLGVEKTEPRVVKGDTEGRWRRGKEAGRQMLRDLAGLQGCNSRRRPH